MANVLLAPDLLRRLEAFQLAAPRRSRGFARGERRSRARGHSVEFADYRDYAPGDDFRYLDWNLYGRLERLYLKLYEEERELPVTIALDASESMTFGEPRKFDFARRVAAAVGYVALCGFDRLRLAVFPDRPENREAARGLRKVRGRASAPSFLGQIAQLEAGGPADLSGALQRVALETRQPGLAVVISDFLDPAGYEIGLKALWGRGFQVSVVQVLAPEEWTPAAAGDLRVVDCETGQAEDVTFGRYRLAAYQRVARDYCDRLAARCRRQGSPCFLAQSDAPLEDLLLKKLRQAGIWG